MKTLFSLFLLTMLVTSSTTSQHKEPEYYYCIQVLSTENPELLKPPYFNDAYGEAMVEEAIVNRRKYYRIIFIFVSLEKQEIAFKSWKKQYPNAIRVTRTEQQIQDMYPLFFE